MSYNYNILLDKYFRGTATTEEFDALEKWIAQSPENQNLFDNATILFEQLNSDEDTVNTFDLQKAEEKFKNHIQSSVKQKNTKNIRPKTYFWTGIAASITVLFFITYIGWKHIQTVDDNEIAYTTSSNTLHKILPDSTVITLSKNSKVRYCKKEAGQKQIIKLQGEASIDIAPKESGKVIIDAGDVYIQDIGTAFTVSAYPNEKIVTVKVNEGSVNLYTKEDKGINLTAGETGTYNKSTKQFEKAIAQEVPQTKTQGEQTEIIEFKNKSLNTVIQDINRKYNTNIYINDHSLDDQKITAAFSDESLDVVLEIISEAMNIKVTKTTKGYLLEKSQLE